MSGSGTLVIQKERHAFLMSLDPNGQHLMGVRGALQDGGYIVHSLFASSLMPCVLQVSQESVVVCDEVGVHVDHEGEVQRNVERVLKALRPAPFVVRLVLPGHRRVDKDDPVRWTKIELGSEGEILKQILRRSG